MVYAIALVVVLAMFFFTAIGPVLESGPPALPNSSEQPPRPPGAPGR
ncbi:MAG: hypothetical protein QGI32_19680 [Candidatus Latescibacteria bacterium]|nr:hypothetical protein [Candidatus Latescibacterota bacterium]